MGKDAQRDGFWKWGKLSKMIFSIYYTIFLQDEVEKSVLKTFGSKEV